MMRLAQVFVFALTIVSPLFAADYASHPFPAGYRVYALNGLGQVTGTANGQIFLWSRTGGFQYLGNENGGISVPFSINDSGEIAGMTTISGDTFHVFVWTESGGFQDPDSPFGGNTEFAANNSLGLNSAGNVAGLTSAPDDSKHHAFFWSSSTGSEDIGTLSGYISSQSNVLNNEGEVAGIAIDSGGNETAFKWTHSGGISALPSFGGNSWPDAINDSDEIAGFSYFPNFTSHAALWDANDNIHDLGTLPGDTLSSASFLNASGNVAGCSGSTCTGFFWTQNTGMTDIGAGPLNGPFGLNNRDQIIGQTAGQNSYVFLWSPTLGIHQITSGKLISTGMGPNDAGQFFTNGTFRDRLWTPVMHVSLSSSQNPSQAGQPVTFTANVSAIVGLPPDGEQIKFLDGGKKIGTGNLTNGVASFTTSNLGAGTHNITAKYVGDNNYTQSKSPVLQQVVNP